MAIAISYAATRPEIWNYYWRMWRQGLWKAHLFVFVIVAVLTYSALPANDLSVAAAIAAASVTILFFVLYPQLRYKAETRELILSEDGITTSIGRRRADIPWSDIAAIDADELSFVIQRSNLNALIVPARAFASPDERAEFEAFVRTHTDARGR
ncbi:MAG: YcxB family protein [Sphingomonas paucimobilis]